MHYDKYNFTPMVMCSYRVITQAELLLFIRPTNLLSEVFPGHLCLATDFWRYPPICSTCCIYDLHYAKYNTFPIMIVLFLWIRQAEVLLLSLNKANTFWESSQSSMPFEDLSTWEEPWRLQLWDMGLIPSASRFTII